MQNDGVRIGLRLLKPETVRWLRRELQRGVPAGPLPHSYLDWPRFRGHPIPVKKETHTGSPLHGAADAPRRPGRPTYSPCRTSTATTSRPPTAQRPVRATQNAHAGAGRQHRGALVRAPPQSHSYCGDRSPTSPAQIDAPNTSPDTLLGGGGASQPCYAGSSYGQGVGHAQ